MIAFLKLLIRERILPLLVATLALVAWQHWGMETVRVIAPTAFRATPRDDRADGGASVCTVEERGGAWVLRYDIRPGISWAFCGMSIDLFDSSTGRGMDLSGDDTLALFLERAQGPNDLLQVQMLDMDTAIYRRGEPMTMKFLSMVFIPSPESGVRHSLPLSLFSVPGWWAARLRIPTEHQERLRDDVRAMEILTSNGRIPYGTGEIAISRVELHGKWIRQEALVRILLAVWLVYAFAFVCVRLVRSLRREHCLRLEASKLQELAGRDPLTGVLNRRGFEDAFASILARRGADGPVGVLMLDLDHFKRINDSMGHHAGDEILRQLARILRAHLRDGHLCCRYGGEEFLLVVPGITSVRLRLLAETLRQAIERGISCGAQPVTASVGITCGAMEEITALVRRADDALYKAKGAGRNRVEEA